MCARNTLELRWPTNWHGQVLEKLWHSKFWERFQFSSPSSVCIDSACIGQSVGIWVSILILRRSVDNSELRQVGENNFRVKKFLIGGIWTTRPSTVLGFRWTIEGQNLQPRISKYWNVAKFGANVLWSQFFSLGPFSSWHLKISQTNKSLERINPPAAEVLSWLLLHKMLAGCAMLLAAHSKDAKHHLRTGCSIWPVFCDILESQHFGVNTSGPVNTVNAAFCNGSPAPEMQVLHGQLDTVHWNSVYNFGITRCQIRRGELNFHKPATLWLVQTLSFHLHFNWGASEDKRLSCWGCTA